MKFVFFSHAPDYAIDESDKQRLERFAPMFDICFAKVSEAQYEIKVEDDAGARTVTLNASIAHLRLLAELCEKVLNWVYFREQEHCAKTLLSLPDAKVKRLAELYRLRRNTRPST